jgi:hypothetical protein
MPMGAFNCASRVAFDDSRVMFSRAVEMEMR